MGSEYRAGKYPAIVCLLTFHTSAIQSYVYVENCALAHLLYEQRLLELASGSSNPDIGGQAFTITDPNPPITYGDVYKVLRCLSPSDTRFIFLPPALVLSAAHLLEAYYLLRFRHRLLSRMLPELKVPPVF